MIRDNLKCFKLDSKVINFKTGFIAGLWTQKTTTVRSAASSLPQILLRSSWIGATKSNSF